MVKIQIYTLIFFLLIQNCFANESGIFSEIGSDLATPITTPARNLFLSGLVSTSLVYLNSREKNYRKRVSFDDSKPLGDFGFIGDTVGYGLLNVSYVLSTWIYGKNKNDQLALKNAELMARASFYTAAVSNIMKATIHETRPGYPDKHDSFPSGHSSAAFAFATVVAANHGWMWGGLAHGAAGFISISRINDDFHYLHDVIAGITIGISYGWGLHYNFEKGAPYWFSAIPVPGGSGLLVGIDF